MLSLLLLLLVWQAKRLTTLFEALHGCILMVFSADKEEGSKKKIKTQKDKSNNEM
jgi:hypothetical protein